MTGSQRLKVLEGTFAVCRLAPGAEWPDWARGGPLSAVVETERELSVVCPAQRVPAGVPAASGWMALEVEGPLDFAQVGVLAGLSAPLAAAGVSLLALSTHDTDYLLVARDRLSEAVSALRAAGHDVADVS